MKILFVNLCDYQAVDESSRNLPLGLLSLATVINHSGSHVAQVIDFNNLYKKSIKVNKVLKVNIEHDAKYILSIDADVISFYTMCNNYHIAILLANKIKNEDNKRILLFGGPQATAVAKKTLERFPFVDGIGLGEGENTIFGILDGLEKGDFSQTKGLAYRDNENIILHYNDELIQDLDELPMIDLGLFTDKIENGLDLDIGRGCPYSCIFCSTKLFWKRRFRIKSAKRIYDEILYYKSHYGVKEFNFQHDLFVANRKLVLELCDMLKNNNVNITWYCSARVDTVDDELLRWMYDAGCRGIFFGIESCVEKTQKYIKKNLDISQIEDLPDLLVKNNIEGTLSFIYGFPEETKAEIDENLMSIYRLIDMHHADVIKEKLNFQLHKLIFLPNTELTERHKHELVHNPGYSMEVYIALDQWGDEELKEIISDVELFPNLSCIPGSLTQQYQDLDKFFSYVFMTSIFLLDITYKLLLEEMNGSFLKIYEVFQAAADKEELDRFYAGFTKKDSHKNEFILATMEKVIREYPFKRIEREAIEDMFAFERDIYLQLYKSKEDRKEINIQKEYQYDVVQMRMDRNPRYRKKLTIVRFYTEHGKYIMKKEENENNPFPIMNIRLMEDLQISS